MDSINDRKLLSKELMCMRAELLKNDIDKKMEELDNMCAEYDSLVKLISDNKKEFHSPQRTTSPVDVFTDIQDTDNMTAELSDNTAIWDRIVRLHNEKNIN